jgi:hypothetical protein
METVDRAEPKLASRRGLRRQSSYAHHVETLLQTRVTKE